ncbi:MAG: DUF2442 domain-containing protein [Methylorubrum populi]
MDEAEFHLAEARGRETASGPIAVSAHYLPTRRMLVVTLSTGVELRVPVELVEGLAKAPSAALSVIEITPAGTGLHFPRLDADVFVPALVTGITGSRAWMAQQLGRIGGKARTGSKIDAARANGRLGGRPRKAG